MKSLYCRACTHKNRTNVNFCQGCGAKIKKRFSWRGALEGMGGSALAGTGMRTVTIAPFAAESIRKGPAQASAGNRKNAQAQMLVEPLKDNTWFCPYCGYHNSGTLRRICKSCAKEFRELEQSGNSGA